MQFRQRESAYRLQFASLETRLIFVENELAGSIMLNRNAESISIVDIALSEEWRGQGIGSAVIRDIKIQAVETGLPIVLHVNKTNERAFQFYISHEFSVTAESQIHYRLTWWPDMARPPVDKAVKNPK
jgi:ribosomal protein S18 acetylase RimI-like enzyme